MRQLVIHFVALLLFICCTSAIAQSDLQAKVAAIAADAQGTVCVSCLLPGTTLNCDLNAQNHAPMQSVFKLPLAMTALHLAETGKLLADQAPGESIRVTLGRMVRFLPADCLAGAYSPLQDRYPNANVDVPLRQLIQFAVGESDNVAADMLLRIVGGPLVVRDYIQSLGIAGFDLHDSEHDLDRDPTAMYRDWMEPAAAVQLLQRLVHDRPLSSAANDFLVRTLTGSGTGPHRLRAGLPPGTVLAHKTGTSGEHNGAAEATNDIGLITLPDGRHLSVAVFVTNARASEAVRDSVIARIGRAVYDAAIATY